MAVSAAAKAAGCSALGAMVFGALLAAGIGATSANELSGAGYLVGGRVFSLYLYTLLVLLAMGALGLLWNIPKRIEQVLLLTIPLALTTVGAMQANAFVVTETDIALPKLKSAVSVMLISDVRLGHHRGAQYLHPSATGVPSRKHYPVLRWLPTGQRC